MVRVSVIIPVYNDPDRLRQCLDALAGQTLRAEEFEVIVVDNGSDDPPRSLVDGYAFCRFATERKPGSYAARNHGISLAQGDVFAFTDSDCLPEPKWLSGGLETLGQTGKSIVGGKMVIFPRDKSAPTAVELVDMAFGLDQEANIHKTGFSVTANLFAPRGAFEAVGDFDQEVLSGGDHDWCVRAVQGGYDLLYNPEAIVRHPARTTLSSAIRQARRIVGGRMDRGHRRNPLTLHYWWTIARAVLPNFGKILRCRRRLADRGYGLIDWLRTIPVILTLQYAKFFEFVRKRLGFSSERT